MAGQRRRKRIGRGVGQPRAACRLVRFTRPRVLPEALLAEALAPLSPGQRASVLARFDHLNRAHPDPPPDDRTAAVLRILDTPAYRAELARDLLVTRGTEDGYPPWRVADAVLDLNQEQSQIARSVLVERLSEAAGGPEDRARGD